MAEYIDRDVLCAAIEKHCYDVSGDLPDKSIVKQVYKMAYSHIQDVVRALPAADVVEVVRCKDCKRCVTRLVMGQQRWYCKNWFLVRADFYCADGERRTEE